MKVHFDKAPPHAVASWGACGARGALVHTRNPTEVTCRRCRGSRSFRQLWLPFGTTIKSYT